MGPEAVYVGSWRAVVVAVAVQAQPAVILVEVAAVPLGVVVVPVAATRAVGSAEGMEMAVQVQVVGAAEPAITMIPSPPAK